METDQFTFGFSLFQLTFSRIFGTMLCEEQRMAVAKNYISAPFALNKSDKIKRETLSLVWLIRKCEKNIVYSF